MQLGIKEIERSKTREVATSADILVDHLIPNSVMGWVYTELGIKCSLVYLLV